MNIYIIGGGAAGVLAAVSAKRHNPHYEVTIVDRTFALGRKLLVCGAGRCNITNKYLDSSLEKAYHGAPHLFVHTIFSQFGYQDIIRFFAELGVETYTEQKTTIGKVFPVTDQAQTITELLLDEVQRLGIQIQLNTEVTAFWQNDNDTFTLKASSINKKREVQEQHTYTADKVILTTGGKSYPALGSNGSGYPLAESFGHTVVPPVPAAVSLAASNQLSHLLQRVKLPLQVTAIVDGKPQKTDTDDVMFTNYGLSGPAILNISRDISIHFNREHGTNAAVRINFFPNKTPDQARTLMEERWKKRPNQSVQISFYGLFPNKVPRAILKILQIDANTPVKELTGGQKKTLIKSMTAWDVPVQGTRGWNEAEFTAGGIRTTEITAETLESTLCPGLYLAGEVLNVDGDVGGFNLSWSWASGFVAGKLN